MTDKWQPKTHHVREAFLSQGGLGWHPQNRIIREQLFDLWLEGVEHEAVIDFLDQVAVEWVDEFPEVACAAIIMRRKLEDPND